MFISSFEFRLALLVRNLASVQEFEPKTQQNFDRPNVQSGLYLVVDSEAAVG